jgi:hypothetical protein
VGVPTPYLIAGGAETFEPSPLSLQNFIQVERQWSPGLDVEVQSEGN